MPYLPPDLTDPTRGSKRISLFISDELFDILVKHSAEFKISPGIFARRMLGNNFGLFGEEKDVDVKQAY